MKKLYSKINELWMRYKQWSEGSIIGDFTFGVIKFIFVATAFLFLVYGLLAIGSFRDKNKTLLQPFSLSDFGVTKNDNCSVAGINLRGTLITYIPYHGENDPSFDYDVVASDYTVGAIQKANDDPKIRAILIEVDSEGGSAIAGEEISDAIKNSDKPTTAFIRGAGVSAAYLAISSVDKIFASKYSDVGGIGVTSSYLSSVEKNKKDGYTYEQLSAGKYKDSGSPDKPLTSEERLLFLRDINIMYKNFIEEVSQNRRIPIEKVRGFADGSTVLGEKAKSLGLIDEIGGISDAKEYLEGIIKENPEICWQ